LDFRGKLGDTLEMLSLSLLSVLNGKILTVKFCTKPAFIFTRGSQGFKIYRKLHLACTQELQRLQKTELQLSISKLDK